MLHRIRLAMQTGSFEKFTGEVEAAYSFAGATAALDRAIEAGEGPTNDYTDWAIDSQYQYIGDEHILTPAGCERRPGAGPPQGG